MSDVRLTVSGDTSKLEGDIRRALRKGEHKLSLDTKNFSRPLGQITGELGEFGKSLEASNARVLAFGASAGAIYAVGAAIKSSVEAAVNLEKQLAEINVILGTSQKQLLGFGNELFQIAKDTGQAFNEVAEGAKELARQGLGMAESLKRTSDALILSRLTGLAAAEAVNTLTAAINGYSSAALTSSQVTNKIIAVDQAFAVSGKDLAEALKRVGSTAAAAGVSFDELLGVVTAAQQITARGGSVIGNSFKTIFTRLQRPRTIEALDALGIATKDASGAMLPLMQVMTNLAKEFDGLSQAQQSNIAQLVGGVFQINVLKAALSDLGREYSIFGRATNISASATDEANRRNAELNKTLAAQLNALVQNVTRVGAVIGKLGLEPALKRAVGLLNSFMDRIDISDSESIGAKIGSGLLSGLGNFLSGPGLLILGAGIYKLFGFLTAQAKDALKTILQANTALGQRKQSEQAIITVLQQDQKLVAAITAGTISHADAVEKVRRSIVSATVAQRELNAVAAAAVASGVTVGRGGARGGKAAGYMPNFVRDEFRSEEAIAQALGASSSVKAHKSKGTIGGRKFVMNNQEIEIPHFGRNGDSAVIPQYYKGFIPNFTTMSVAQFTGQYPRVARTLKTNPNVEPDDRITVPPFKTVSLKRRKGESEAAYERRALKSIGATDSRGSMKYGSSAAVDGFMGRGNNTLVEVKGGSYSKKDVQDKFARGLLENAGLRSSGAKSMFQGRFAERVKRRRDSVRLNKPILIAATKGGSFATGFIPNFARKENPLKTALMGGTASAGPALQALMSDPQGARKLAGVLQGGARGGGAGLQVSPQVRGMIAEAFPNIGQRSAMRTAERAAAAAERHSGPRLNVLGLNTLGARSISKPGIREFGFRDPRIRRNFERGFNRRYMMFARGLAGDMIKGIPNQRKMMKAFTSRPPDPAATGQVKGRVFESIVSGMVTGMPSRMKGNEAVDLGRGTRIRSEFASLFTPGAAKIGTGMEIRLGGAGGITSADARDKFRRFRGRASGYLPNFAFLEELGSAMAAEEAGMKMSGRSGKARFGTDPRVGPMVYSSFQGTPAQAVNDHLHAGQKFSTLKDSGKALRAAGYIPNFMVSNIPHPDLRGGGGGGAPSSTDGDGVKELDKKTKKAAFDTEKFSSMMMNASFALSFAGGAASELAKSMGGSDKLGEQINSLSSNLSMAATAAMLIPGPAGLAAAAIGASAALIGFAFKRIATKNEELIKEAENSKAQFQKLNDSVGQYSNAMQQYKDALKASNPDPKAILALQEKLTDISNELPPAFQNMILAAKDTAELQKKLGEALEAEAKRVQGLQSAGSLQDKINESFGKMFGGGKLFEGTEGKLLMKQILDDTKKSMDFNKFAADLESGSFTLAGKSTDQIISELQNMYGLSEDLALVFTDLADRGKLGKEQLMMLAAELEHTGKNAGKTAKQLKRLTEQQKAEALLNQQAQKGLKHAQQLQKLVNDYINLNTKLLIKFGDALVDSAKKIHFARAEMAIESASPFLTEEAQAKLDFQLSKEQAKDAEIQANKEGMREIGAAFLEGVENILSQSDKDHSELLAAMAPFAEAGKIPTLLEMINGQLMDQGKIDRTLQMQLAAAAQGSLAEIIALTERNGIKLDTDVKIAAMQYELAKQQAQLERDLKAGGGLDKFLDPDSLGKDLGNLGKNIEMFTIASKRGDNQQRGRGLLGIVDFMQQSGRLGSLNPDDQNDAKTIQTIANAQGEALRMQFLGIERMLMQAFRQTGDNSLIPLIRIMRRNARDAYRIAHTQLMERIKSRKIPEATLKIMSDLKDLLDEQQKEINQATTDTATNTGKLVNRFPELKKAFEEVDKFFKGIKDEWRESFRDIKNTTNAIGMLNRKVTFLPRAIANELRPVLENVLSGALAPLTLQQGIERDQNQIAQLQGQLDNMVTPEKRMQARQRLIENMSNQAGVGINQQASFVSEGGRLMRDYDVSFFKAGTKMYRTLEKVAKKMASSAGQNFDTLGTEAKQAFRKRAAAQYGLDFGLQRDDEGNFSAAYFRKSFSEFGPFWTGKRNAPGQSAVDVQNLSNKLGQDLTKALVAALGSQTGREFLRSKGVLGADGSFDASAFAQMTNTDKRKFLSNANMDRQTQSIVMAGVSAGGIFEDELKDVRFLERLGAQTDDKLLNMEMRRLGMITQAQINQMLQLTQQIAALNARIEQSKRAQAGFGNLQTLQSAGLRGTGAGGQNVGVVTTGGSAGELGAGGQQLVGAGGNLTWSNVTPLGQRAGFRNGAAFTGIRGGMVVTQIGRKGNGRPIMQVLGQSGMPLGQVNMQEGGIVTRRMNATLGERGPEAVIPLDRAIRGVNQTPATEKAKAKEGDNPLDIQRNNLLQAIGEELVMLRQQQVAGMQQNMQVLSALNQQLIMTRNAIIASSVQMMQNMQGQLNLLGAVGANQGALSQQVQQTAGATNSIASTLPASARTGVSSAFNDQITQIMNARYPGHSASRFPFAMHSINSEMQF